MRNPMILFTIGSFIVFTVTQRFFEKHSGKRERSSVIWTNIAIAALVGWIMLEVGWAAFLLVEVPVLLIACGAGVWLFYVQHNFDPTYWEHHQEWEFFNAGMDGSSFYKLPKVLQWFTGNIGFHHIHHLSPKIPNYKLEQCHKENPMFQIEPLTFATPSCFTRSSYWVYLFLQNEIKIAVWKPNYTTVLLVYIIVHC